MGYYARGSGDAVLKKGVNKDDLIKILDAITFNDCAEMEYDFDAIGTTETINFWEYDTHWHEENTMEFLNALIPYIEDGCAEYTGDDDCYWRYILKDGNWEVENGTVYYSLNDMARELERNGYTVIAN